MKPVRKGTLWVLLLAFVHSMGVALTGGSPIPAFIGGLFLATAAYVQGYSGGRIDGWWRRQHEVKARIEAVQAQFPQGAEK